MALPWLFEFWALPHQLPPEGDWKSWVIMGGRGAGKTRAGAEWVRRMVEGPSAAAPGRCQRVALVGETFDQVREVMIFGESGILACSPPDRRPVWEAGRKRLVWANGATATCYSAHEPEAMRGPQFDAAWVDELMRRGQWGQAYAHWAGSLRPGARLSPVFNPDFELPPSNSGFDWRIRPLPGQTVSIEHGVAGAQGAVAALEFRRRPAAVAGLEQALLLAPGQHTLKVRQRTDQLRSDAGLEWIVACGDGRVLGRSERFGGSADWHTLSAPVQVPTDCPGQWLRLRNPAPTERTRVTEGRLWIDRAWIVRDDA